MFGTLVRKAAFMSAAEQSGFNPRMPYAEATEREASSSLYLQLQLSVGFFFTLSNNGKVRFWNGKIVFVVVNVTVKLPNQYDPILIIFVVTTALIVPLWVSSFLFFQAFVTLCVVSGRPKCHLYCALYPENVTHMFICLCL